MDPTRASYAGALAPWPSARDLVGNVLLALCCPPALVLYYLPLGLAYAVFHALVACGVSKPSSLRAPGERRAGAHTMGGAAEALAPAGALDRAPPPLPVAQPLPAPTEQSPAEPGPSSKLSAFVVTTNVANSGIVFPGETIHGRVALSYAGALPRGLTVQLVCTEALNFSYESVKKSTTHLVVVKVVNTTRRTNESTNEYEHYAVTARVDLETGCFSVMVPRDAPPSFVHPLEKSVSKGEQSGEPVWTKIDQARLVHQLKVSVPRAGDTMQWSGGAVRVGAVPVPADWALLPLVPAWALSEPDLQSCCCCCAAHGTLDAAVALPPPGVLLTETSRAPSWASVGLHSALGGPHAARFGAVHLKLAHKVEIIGAVSKEFKKRWHDDDAITSGVMLKVHEVALPPVAAGTDGVMRAARLVELPLRASHSPTFVSHFFRQSYWLKVTFADTRTECTDKLVCRRAAVYDDAVVRVPLLVTDNPVAVAALLESRARAALASDATGAAKGLAYGIPGGGGDAVVVTVNPVGSAAVATTSGDPGAAKY